jgi:hypothetical protein
LGCAAEVALLRRKKSKQNGEDTTFQREEKRGDWRTEKNSFNL